MEGFVPCCGAGDVVVCGLSLGEQVRAFAIKELGDGDLVTLASATPNAPQAGTAATTLTWTFHCDRSSKGTASLTSWPVTSVYCCKAACWVADSVPMSNSPSLAMVPPGALGSSALSLGNQGTQDRINRRRLGSAGVDSGLGRGGELGAGGCTMCR